MHKQSLVKQGWTFVHHTAIALVAIGATALLADAQTFTPVHPPAAPLITRGPYVSTWLGNSTGVAPGTRTTFWDGTGKPITGIAAIDGKSWLFFGSPEGTTVPYTMTQTSLETTPTQSIFTFQGGGVTLTVDFLSPVETHDLKRLSIPLADIIATAKSSDGASHQVTLYFDIGGEWADGSLSDQIKWAPETVPLAVSNTAAGQLAIWTATPNTPLVFNTPVSTQQNYALWGNVLWATAAGSGLTLQSGQDIVVRGQFLSAGSLTGGNDTNQPRAIDDQHPVFAFARSLGTVSATPSQPFTLLLGHVRDPAINFLGNPVRSLWTQYFPSYEDMLVFAYNDQDETLQRSKRLDAKITAEATALFGPHYAALTALSLRQAFAGTELTNTADDPLMFLEEISSDNDVSSTDIIYPAMPVFLYLNPELLRYLLEPVIDYSTSGQWPETYAPHDLGGRPDFGYPNAIGHNLGGGEIMPAESSAGMLLMADAYMQRVPSAEAASYATAHYAIFKQWADFLLATPTQVAAGCSTSGTAPGGIVLPYAFDTQYQLTTLDALGCVPHDLRLTLKSLLAVGAMGQIAEIAGKPSDAAYYGAKSRQAAVFWSLYGQNSTHTHLLRSYREPANPVSPSTTSESDSDWSQKFDMYVDSLLGLHLVPTEIKAEEAAFYRTQENPMGILLLPETIATPSGTQTQFTTTFWQVWTGAGTGDKGLEQDIVDEVFDYANSSTSGRPFPDRYDPLSTYNQFEARPVVGGIFAPLLMTPPKEEGK